MSALERRSKSLAGLTLDAVLSGEIAQPEQPPPPPEQSNRTLFDIIKEDNKEFGSHKDKKTWKTFRDKLRLKRTGSAWTSSVTIPTSDIPIPQNNHYRKNRRNSHREPSRTQSVGLIHEAAHREDLINNVPMSDPPVSSGRPMFTRGSSMRVAATNHPDDSANSSMPYDGPPSRSFKPQIGRHGSIRDHGDGEEESMRRHPVVTFADKERTLSAREAVAAQEAAEAEAAAAAAAAEKEEENEGEEKNSGEPEDKAAKGQKPVMSLMDLLEDYDDYDDEEDYDEEEEGEEEGGGENDGDDVGGGEEFNCCVCMVKIKGAQFIPCGHTFCRMCSRELMVQKGHCPACSNFIVEFLEIF